MNSSGKSNFSKSAAAEGSAALVSGAGSEVNPGGKMGDSLVNRPGS